MCARALALPVSRSSSRARMGGPRAVRPRGARVRVGPGRRTAGDPFGQGLLGDLLGREPARDQAPHRAGVERGGMGVWVVGERGALLVRPAGGASTLFACASRRRPWPLRPDRPPAPGPEAGRSRLRDRRKPRVRRRDVAHPATDAGDVASGAGRGRGSSALSVPAARARAIESRSAAGTKGGTALRLSPLGGPNAGSGRSQCYEFRRRVC